MRQRMPLLVVLFVMFSIFSSQSVYARDFTRESIYFILVDRFHDGDPGNNPTGPIFSPDRSEWKLHWGGDLQGIIDKLPYIKKMGFSAIWLTPIFDNTEDVYYYGPNKEEKISAYHGYWGRDFFRINEYFGSMDTFRNLVKTAHENDIRIVFDYVLNHTSPEGQGIDGAIYRDGEFIADYRKSPNNWFHHNGSIDFRVNTPEEWQNKNLYDLADLNSSNPEVERYLFEAAEMWLSTGIDAFRLDTVRHIPIDQCARFVQAMKKVNPDVYIFGEWSMGGLDVPEAVDFTKRSGVNLIDFKFTYYITDVLCRNLSFKKLADYITHDKSIANPQEMVTCIDNHDMPRFISTAIELGADMDLAKRKTELATYIMLTTRGIPCVYYGTEEFLHVDKRSSWGYGGEPYNRQMMTNWDNWNDFRENIAVLNRLRRDVPAISRGTQRTVHVTKDVWVYERQYGDSVVLVAVNKGKDQRIRIRGSRLPEGSYEGVTETSGLVMGPSISVKRGSAEFTLPDHGMGIWYSNR